jgi:hypothetical protein
VEAYFREVERSLNGVPPMNILNYDETNWSSNTNPPPKHTTHLWNTLTKHPN